MKQKKQRKIITSPVDLRLTGRYGGPNPARWHWEQINHNEREITVREATDEFDWPAWTNGKRPIPSYPQRYSIMGSAARKVEKLAIQSKIPVVGMYGPGGRGKVWSLPQSGRVTDIRRLADAFGQETEAIKKKQGKSDVIGEYATKGYDGLQSPPIDLQNRMPGIAIQIGLTRERDRLLAEEERKRLKVPVIICPKCGAENREGAKFCDNCAVKLM